MPIFLVLVLVTLGTVLAEDNTSKKEGWVIGGVPSLGYNSDTGFSYGMTAEIYNLGDGRWYPDYQYALEAEWIRNTQGGGVTEIFLDAPVLYDGTLRLTGYAGYETDLMQRFYGFGGYASDYHPEYEIDDPDHPDYDRDSYRSRAYYTHDRALVRVSIDVQGDLGGPWRWLAGAGSYQLEAGPTKTGQLRGDVPQETLFEELVQGEKIAAEEADGGAEHYLKLGLIYDTRDAESVPTNGIWTELFLTEFGEYLGTETPHQLLTFTHRHYFPLASENLVFAGRLSAQDVVTGNAPFYMLPFLQSSYKVQEGFGGSQTIRGVLQNRVVGASVVFANMEVRWNVYRFTLKGQQFEWTLNGFYDSGRVLDVASDHLHHGVGLGLSVIMNRNLVASLDLAKALNPQDGRGGIYIHSGYLF